MVTLRIAQLAGNSDKRGKGIEYKKRVFVDMDNVLVGFESGLARVSEEVKREYDGRLDEIPRLFTLVKPMPGTIEAMRDWYGAKLAEHKSDLKNRTLLAIEMVTQKSLPDEYCITQFGEGLTSVERIILFRHLQMLFSAVISFQRTTISMRLKVDSGRSVIGR